ncbi:hypothetical protein CRI94_17130 [Longibacter salinarum]|uniref:Secretin/TonB short N-terminal domain-containing protein n=1 Tax=Longibacter salinarum TaxID=1850348 RepID=A0A2A8CTL5_9BACT|nr:carboxypeptidase-like regulatory domain-containing protein [Longibacter salinarum]PEN10951.1 hypothetical protein CRI94_17130 [Longibacter salinarum]
MALRTFTSWLFVAVLIAALGWPEAPCAAQDAAPDSDAEIAASDSLYSMALRGVPLATALERFVAVTEASMAYDADLVRGRRSFCSARALPAPKLLRCILKDTDLDYVLSSNGTYIIIGSPKTKARYGQIAGVVVDASTGEPLPDANIILADAATGTSTNTSGLFQLSKLVEGPHEVMVSYVGYEMAVLRIEVEPGQQTKRKIELTPRPLLTEPVIVDGLQPRMPSSSLGQEAAEAGELEEPAASTGTGDIARTAGTLMGIATQSPLADLHIQGGASGEHEMVLDGVPVRNPVSVGRLISAFSPLALGRLTTHKAGYGAMKGSYLSGVVELEHDLTRRNTRWATLSADPVSTNARAQGTFEIYGRPITVMGTARVGMWDVYQDPALHALIQDWSSLDPLLARAWAYPTASSSDPTLSDVSLSSAGYNHQPAVQFSDWHTAARVELTPYRYLFVSGYHGRSAIGASLIMDSPMDESPGSVDSTQAPPIPAYDRYGWNNTTGQARLEWLIGDRTIGSVQTYASHYDARSQYRTGVSTLGPSQDSDSTSYSQGGLWRPDDRNQISELGARARLDIGISADRRIELEAGVEHLRSRFRVGNAFIPTLQHDLTATRAILSANGEWAINEQTIVETGTRLTYVHSRSTVYSEPRLAIRFDDPDTPIGDYSLRLAGGIYRQFTSQFDISRDGASAVVPTASVWLPTDHSIAPPRAYHVSAEGLWTPTDGLTINVESYAKFQPHLLAIDYPTLRTGVAIFTKDSPDQSTFISSSRGRAIGAGIRVAYENEVVNTSVSYNISQAERTFPNRFDGRRVPTPWNEPHRVDAQAELNIGAGFSLQTSWTGIWGRAWAFRKAYYDYLTGRSYSQNNTAGFNRVANVIEQPEAPGFNRPGDDVLPPFLNVDVGFGYNRTFGGVEIGALLQVSNVLDRSNVIDRSLIPRFITYTDRPRTLPGRLPTLSLTVGY